LIVIQEEFVISIPNLWENDFDTKEIESLPQIQFFNPYIFAT